MSIVGRLVEVWKSQKRGGKGKESNDTPGGVDQGVANKFKGVNDL